ncbi:hypothetical protein ACS0TY_035801 [Phlomoides rotata]
MDMEEQITNIVWADARMLIDYEYFGDVVSLDTTYYTNRAHQPLAILSGFNHHRDYSIIQIVVRNLFRSTQAKKAFDYLHQLGSSYDETKFEEACSALLEQFNVQENTWLQSTYNLKKK